MTHFDIASPRARIAWLSPDEQSKGRAEPAFDAAGYALVDVEGAFPPDVAVVDLREHRLSAKSVQTLAQLTRQAAPDCGLVYIAPFTLSAHERAHLRRSGDLVLAGDDLSVVVDACRHRLRLRNIAEETGERLKSIAASTRLSEFPPIETSNAKPRVLVAGAPGPSSLSALAATEAVAEQTVGALTAAQAMRALESGRFDCAVFIPGGEGDPLMGLARSMRRHRKFQDLPLIVVGGDGLEARKCRFSSAYVADIVLPRHASEDLGARILSVTRRARLAAAMRRFLSACAGDGVRDKMSGAFAPPFFAMHAERIFARADQTRRPLSVVGVRLSPVAPNETEARASRMLADAARLINRVTRAEDFVARLSPDTFIVLMAATTERDADTASKRISGVIANTMFRTKNEKLSFAVAAATTAIQRERRGRLDETVARVFVSLNQAKAQTAEQ